MRSRGYLQLSVEKEPLDESIGLSILPVIQGKENDEIPFWEASWDKWKNHSSAHVMSELTKTRLIDIQVELI